MKRELRSDSELLQSFIGGNKLSINPLISRHRSRVYNYILMMVKDPATADDIFQETFLKVIASVERGTYVDNGRFVSWVLRIAHNQVIDHFRSSRTSQHVTSDDVGFDILSRSSIMEDNAEDKLINEQTAQKVRALVDTLPAEQREVVMLRHFMDLSFKEIADQTGVSINTALGRMRYALINMRKTIDTKQLSLV